jgi:pyruvate dehydrogenase E1 component alpha subunit
MPRKSIALEPVTTLSILDEFGNVDRALLPKIAVEKLLRMYRTMVRSRRLEENMLRRQRQGQMGTFAPATGQEACQVGAMAALEDRDWLVPSFRELPAALWRGASMRNVYLYTMGFEEGSEVGDPEKDRSLPISIPVGSQACHAAGLGWASKLKGEDAVAIGFFGEGATSEGAVHEAMNFAGVMKLPVVFFNQNNQWAISTPRRIQTASPTIAQKAAAYGFPGVQVDGNDVFAVYRAVSEAAERARRGDGATLIEAVTWRMSFHTTADDPRVYRTEEEENAWLPKDPIVRLKKHLEAEKIWDGKDEAQLLADVDREVSESFDAAVAYRDGHVDPLEIFDFVFRETPPDLLRQKEQARAAFGDRRVVVGAGKERTKPGGAAAVGELEEAEEAAQPEATAAEPAAQQAQGGEPEAGEEPASRQDGAQRPTNESTARRTPPAKKGGAR